MRQRITWLLAGVALGAVGVFLLLRSGNKPSDLQGTDANRDGVRDDVESYISEHYPDERVRTAARHLHMGIQAAMLDPMGHDENLILCASSCLAGLSDKHIGVEIEALTANTVERIKAYLEAESRDDGKILGCQLTDEEACAYGEQNRR